jgi:hypothetical protein
VKILLDEGVPIQIRAAISNHDMRTVQQQGWGSMKNGELLAQAEGTFDLFITCDQNLKYQQNLRDRTLSILELSSNKRKIIEQNFERITEAISRGEKGSFISLALL